MVVVGGGLSSGRGCKTIRPVMILYMILIISHPHEQYNNILMDIYL